VTCFDWSGRDGVSHWGGTPRPCRSCQRPTPLLDDVGRPQHKTCAERDADLVLAPSAPAPEPAARGAEPENSLAEPEAEALW
jgi:hypothetical protein